MQAALDQPPCPCCRQQRRCQQQRQGQRSCRGAVPAHILHGRHTQDVASGLGELRQVGGGKKDRALVAGRQSSGSRAGQITSRLHNSGWQLHSSSLSMLKSSAQRTNTDWQHTP